LKVESWKLKSPSTAKISLTQMQDWSAKEIQGSLTEQKGETVCK
jgi:hypothetical protein